MSTRFKRASIVPFDDAGKKEQDDKAIPFDFNPETLTLKVTAGKSKDKARKGRQQVQNAGTSEATLSFDAIFDSTRPRDGDDGRTPEAEEKLDVRLRTMALAALIQAPENKDAGGGKGKDQPAPKRVQFRWGSIIFNGLITSYQETFDYFSPGGVPLRSKVQITLTEQEFRYEVNADERAQATAAAPPAPAGLRDAASAAGADSLFDLGSGGLSLGLSADLSLGISADFSASVSAGVSLQANLGISADIGLSASAGISLSADAAVDLFGAAALGGGGGTAGKAGLSSGPASAPAAAASPWAPDGPAPGTRAAGLAAVVAGQRASGAAVAAPNATAAVAAAAAAGGAATPIAVRGSPPPVLPRSPGGAFPPALHAAPREIAWDGERRPRWETLSVPRAGAFTVGLSSHAPHAGCGCARCRGGH